MRVSDFKRDLKIVGLSYKKVKKRYDSGHQSGTFEEFISSSSCSYSIIDFGFIWDHTPEKNDYWNQYYQILNILNVGLDISYFIFCGKVLGYNVSEVKRDVYHFTYDVTYLTKNKIKIGCTIFDRKLLERYFKYLMDKLGYELT